MYIAIGALRVRDATSGWIVPTRSIGTGCGQAGLLIRAILYPILERTQLRVATLAVRSSQYFDDVTQVGRGMPKDFLHPLALAAAEFLDGVTDRHLRESAPSRP